MILLDLILSIERLSVDCVLLEPVLITTSDLTLTAQFHPPAGSFFSRGLAFEPDCRPKKFPRTVFCPFSESFIFANCASGSLRPALTLSSALLGIRTHNSRIQPCGTHHSTPTYLIPQPPTFCISFCIFTAARPPPAPPRDD